MHLGTGCNKAQQVVWLGKGLGEHRTEKRSAWEWPLWDAKDEKTEDEYSQAQKQIEGASTEVVGAQNGQKQAGLVPWRALSSLSGNPSYFPWATEVHWKVLFYFFFFIEGYKIQLLYHFSRVDIYALVHDLLFSFWLTWQTLSHLHLYKRANFILFMAE